MIRLPQQPRLTEFPISSWLRTIRSAAQSAQNISGDTAVSTTPYGMNIRQKANTGFFMRWMGDWMENAAYREGDVVQVTTAKAYLGYVSGSTVKTYESHKGIYVCTYPVPSHIDPASFGNFSDEYLSKFIIYSNQREGNVVYAPIYPHPPNSPDALPNGTIQGKFWNLIAFAPDEAKVCEEGEAKTYFVHYAKSGSLEV